MNNDLISREALKEKLKARYYNDGLDIVTAIELIDNAPTVKFSLMPADETKEDAYKRGYEKGKIKGILMANTSPQGEWIPCSERLPDDMKKVLVWYEYYRYGDFNCMYQTYGFCYVCDGKWSPFINGETGWTDARIIAWQPLPKPYYSEVHDD